MSERLNACFGCGAAVPATYNFCEHCQKNLEVDAAGDQIVFSKTLGKLETEKEILERIIQKGLLFKSQFFFGFIYLSVRETD